MKKAQEHRGLRRVLIVFAVLLSLWLVNHFVFLQEHFGKAAAVQQTYAYLTARFPDEEIDRENILYMSYTGQRYYFYLPIIEYRGEIWTIYELNDVLIRCTFPGYFPFYIIRTEEEPLPPP